MTIDAVNINRLWADLIVEELIRSGVDFFCLAPGSRSTPLATAIASHPAAQHLMHFDERGTAYAAVGFARATGRPAAWVTTSGTAVANGLPAVIEAATEGVPMLLLTADRPPELRQTGANQTVQQVNIFGEYVRWQFDVPAPTTDIAPEFVLTTIDQAIHRARRGPKGPVHLNLMFREPLGPDPDGRDLTTYSRGIQRWTDSSRPYTEYVAGEPAADTLKLRVTAHELRPIERGVLTVGKMDGSGHIEAVVRLAEALGWPILPDIGSQLRLGPERCGRAAYFDQVLLDETFAATHAPDAVLHVGGRITSKRLLQFLERSRPAVYVSVRPDPSRLDPGHQVTLAIEADPGDWCAAMVSEIQGAGPKPKQRDWLADWMRRSEAVHKQVDAFLDQHNGLNEPAIARSLSREIPEGYGLFLASSMPIRDFDRYAAPGRSGVRIASNRGASGIDGTIASAAGFARGLQRPVTVLIGDLALLHDLNSLALLRSLPVPVTVVVVNNDGGGIFSFLPISRFEDVFEPFFGTPHGLSFSQAAALFGIRYEHPTTLGGFVDAYRSALGGAAPAIIEVTTDRRENHAFHQRLEEHLSRVV